MTHAQMDELYDLYALGVLERELAAEVDEHLTQNCEYCVQHVSEASKFTGTLAGIAEQKKPPAGLRDRVLASAAPVQHGRSKIQHGRSKNWMLAVAGLGAACLALLIFSLWSQSRMSGMREQVDTLREQLAGLRNRLATVTFERDELAAAGTERNQLRRALDIVSRPDTRALVFGGTHAVHGRVFANRRGGLVFVGSQLPQLAGNRTFELWLVPKTGAPRPAGTFRANAAGDSVHVSSAVVDPAEMKAVAVSVEPREGSAAPTTTPFVVVPLQ